ncbi:MAG: GMC family oxidoreductase, partial [Acidobacteria bacterium]|nr:GMC family oxidoreductase [Acidobacteriota bacterium]
MNADGKHFDAVVVGSGFGGSINALRLTQAGKSVLVLERGKRYKPGEFPRDVTDVKNLFWRYPKHPDFRGLYEMRFFSGISAVVASGVGGGSLIYANIHIRPDSSLFDDPHWPQSINRQSLDPYYDKVAAMLGIAPIPPEIKLIKRDVYREAARKTGHEVFDPDQAVSWKEPVGPGREACRLTAECEFGCQYGAKNTLDLTYLA